MNSFHPCLRAAAAATLAVVFAWPINAQDSPAEAAKLGLAAIDVQPTIPGPDTLCKLTVTVRNDGDRTASQLGFAVSLNGQDLKVYENQLFMYPVLAGETLEIPLYNFWTTETSRPEMPPDGKFQVDVKLLEAQWMDISMVTETVERAGKEVEEEVEVWTPLGPVDGLPTSANLVLGPTDK